MDGPGILAPARSPEEAALLARLDGRARFGMSLGLERMERALAALGHPERAVRSVHVAGTNGKGSTAAFLAHVLAASGRRVGLYTSPHLVSVVERVQLLDRRPRAEPVGLDAFADAVDRADRASAGALTFFELLTAAAHLLFAEAGIEVAVLEAGIGARLDATRVAPAEVGILTSVELEHTEILGATRAAIADEKAHVMRPGRPLVTGAFGEEVDRVVDRRAAEWGCAVLRLGRDFSASAVPEGVRFRLAGARPFEARPALLGRHQHHNAALAVQAARVFDPSLAEGAAATGLASTFWPGRFERFAWAGARGVILDGAHNPSGVEVLLEQLPGLEGPLDLVFGALGDKDVAAMLGRLRPHFRRIVLTRPASARAADPEELQRWAPGAEVIAEPVAALERLGRDAAGAWIVGCGSLVLVGELRRWLTRPELARAQEAG